MSVILKFNSLTKKFPVKRGIFGEKSGSYIHAVDDVNLEVRGGENFGVVGESGCGKSTLVQLIIRLLKPTEGSIEYRGEDIQNLSQEKLSKNIQFVFQDSYASLNPRMTVYDLLIEPINIHYSRMTKKEKNKRIQELLKNIGLKKHHLSRYPHQLSGGQKQRIVIARTLAVEPEIIIMDEPVSDLDVSVKAQILNLLTELKGIFQGTYIFVSHDLSMIRYICDQVAVMYLGQIIELASAKDIFRNPQHPYSEGLLAAVPIPDPMLRGKKELILKGEVPTPINPPNHCRFAKRCIYAKDVCVQKPPRLLEVNPNHFTACFFPNKLRETQQEPFNSESS